MDNLSTDKIWRQFSTNRSTSARRQLIGQYLGLVKYVVNRLKVNLPASIQHEDLIQIGVIGLSEAVDRYDSSLGIKFETYAIPRIKGCVIDEIRKIDWIPRSLRNKKSLINNKIMEFDQTHSGNYCDADIAKSLDVSIDRLNKWQKQINLFNTASLDKHITENNGATLYDIIGDQNTENYEDKIERQEMKTLLLSAINKLPEKNRLAITLYYYEKLTFKEIGDILNISESRVSQIHSQTIRNLKKSISAMASA
jgi:RNA polymerase sigma factor for flagellar operon FliA